MLATSANSLGREHVRTVSPTTELPQFVCRPPCCWFPSAQITDFFCLREKPKILSKIWCIFISGKLKFSKLFLWNANQKCCPIHWLRESHMVNCENGQKPIQHWYTHRSWDRAPTRPLRQKTIPYQAEIAALAPTPTPRLDIRHVRHPKTQELRSSHYAYNINNTRTHTWRQQGPTPNRHRKLGIDLTHHRGWVMGHVGQTPLLEYVSGGLYILCIGLHTGCVWSPIYVNNLCKTLASYCLI
jgi:hypothetical protein